MALVVSKLQSDVSDIFTSMNSNYTDGNEKFAEGISKAVKDYAESGTIQTIDAGSVSAGAFTGKGSGSISCDASLCEEVVLAATKAMNSMTSGGDDCLAAQLAKGVHAMVSAGQVNTTVTGTAVPPTGGSVAVAGTGKGTITCSSSTIESALKAAFKSMVSMVEGGNAYFASQFATAVDSYLKAGVVNTTDIGAVSGAVGVGAMS